MQKFILIFSAVTILVSIGNLHHFVVESKALISATEQSTVSEKASVASNSTVALHSAIDTTIRFKFPNDNLGSDAASQAHEIPHLVLYRDGMPTPGFERTLTALISNLNILPGGVNVKITFETHHSDPDLEPGSDIKFQVWHETVFVPYNKETKQSTDVSFTVTFEPFTKLPHSTIKTPTDYYRYRVSISDSKGNNIQTYSEDYAFLMESQWRVPLPNVLETTPGAAPDELLVYYYDMMPFQRDRQDPRSRIARDDVDAYIQTELVSAMAEAFRVQSIIWEFPWYPEWHNFRRDEDPKTLSVALSESGVWYHGAPPSLGHSMISIRVDGSARAYDNLTDGIMSVFNHELFHNHQRNIYFHFNPQGNIAGKDEAWKMFSEGTAVLASSVGQPSVQFAQNSAQRSYFARANAFVGSEGVFNGDLNKSYDAIPYQSAIYWRFLYEACGGINNGVEDPTTGMKVIRKMLDTLYRGNVVDINISASAVESLPPIMDYVLANSPTCLFQSYKESLMQFAQAIYMLRLDNRSDTNNRGNFYDPYDLYLTPPAATINLVAQSTVVNGDIPSSYGIDFVEIQVASVLSGKFLNIVFNRASNSVADYTVKVVLIKRSWSYFDPAGKFIAVAELPPQGTENGQLEFLPGSMDTDKFDRIGLIITRIDPKEKSSDAGNYSVEIHIE